MELTTQYLREQIIKMATAVEGMLEQCLQDQVSLDDIYPAEDQVNGFHKSIDDGCFKFMALKQPAATDLRMTIAIMKMNGELERIGDQAVSIKRYSKKLSRKYDRLDEMLKLVRRMVRRSVDSFVHLDVAKATDVIQSDFEVNELNREIIQDFLIGMKNQDLPFEEGFSVIRIAKNLERVGDHSTNLCEDVIFVERGDDIRHDPSIKNKRDSSDKQFDDFLEGKSDDREKGDE
jgi:phosphate transport system protein